jgi:hypothetical protein
MSRPESARRAAASRASGRRRPRRVDGAEQQVGVGRAEHGEHVASSIDAPE